MTSSHTGGVFFTTFQASCIKSGVFVLNIVFPSVLLWPAGSRGATVLLILFIFKGLLCFGSLEGKRQNAGKVFSFLFSVHIKEKAKEKQKWIIWFSIRTVRRLQIQVMLCVEEIWTIDVWWIYLVINQENQSKMLLLLLCNHLYIKKKGIVHVCHIKVFIFFIAKSEKSTN